MLSRSLRALSVATLTRVALTASAAAMLMGCGAPPTAQAAAVRQGTAQAVKQVQLEAPMVFIGGGKDQDDVMGLIMMLAGGKDAPVVIVPLASGTPQKSGQAYVDYLRELGYPNASYVLPGPDSSPAELARLASAKAVFFSGGDQSRILAAFGPAWQQALKTARARGCVVAGTSAGAMVWGATAIMGGDPLQTVMHGEDPAHGGIRLGAGLGVASALVVDTHFSERGRVPRLAYAVSKQPGSVGLGVDPATAAIVHPDGRLEVAGRGTVTVVTVPAQPVKAPMSLKDMRVHLLSAGDAIGLNAAPVAP